MKPLYLTSGQRLNISLDGPALLVQGGDRCAGRYPLLRISRVVSATDVSWSTAAMLACLGQGIHVAFLDADGSIVGSCFGARNREATLAARLNGFLDSPNWSDEYTIWQSARDRREILGVLRRLEIDVPDLRPHYVRAMLFNQLLRCGWRGRSGASFKRLSGYLEAAVGPELARTIGEPQTFLHCREGFNLLNDICRLLSWRLFDIMFNLAVGGGEHRPQGLVAAFEATWFTLQQACANHVSSLEQWLREKGY